MEVNNDAIEVDTLFTSSVAKLKRQRAMSDSCQLTVEGLSLPADCAPTHTCY